MSNETDTIRSAADRLDQAREELHFGDLPVENEQSEEILDEIDSALADLESTMRTFALNVDAEKEVYDGGE